MNKDPTPPPKPYNWWLDGYRPEEDAKDFVGEIERIRKDNNTLWMQILRIAVSTSPEETRRVLRSINENDKKISDLLGKV